MLNFGGFLPFLNKKAIFFRQQNWSLIPLLGDLRPDMPKAPALQQWASYQTQLPSYEELDHWFLDCGYQAIGIILGRISNLVVIDIDDMHQAEKFKTFFPDLLNTFTVQSGNRQLPHYYFRIPAYMTVPSRRAPGIELRSDGQYIVAPDSVINGKRWTITHDVDLKMLTESDLNRLLAFLQINTHINGVNRSDADSSANLSQSKSQSQVNSNVTVSGLKRLYRHQALRLGRNNALFVTAQYARDYGWSQERVLKTLKVLHALQPPLASHIPETNRQRIREAIATIASVFKREPRGNISHQSNQQLPNSVRETLLQKNLVNVARILDGLMMKRISPDTQLTPSTIYEHVKSFGIGRNTVYATLKATIEPSPRHPPSNFANADDRYTDNTKQCLFGRVAKPVKNNGRPETLVMMPSVESLCEMLGVDQTFSDQLLPEDLQSPASYRAGLHKALIARSPGQYPRQWLAERLAVSKDSLRRYEQYNGVTVQPVYQTWLLGWHNVDMIVPDEAPPGHFIEDESGKRYPPLLEIARRLLKRVKQIFYRRQDANHYSVPNTDISPQFDDGEQSESVPIGNIPKVWEQSESVPIGNISKVWEQSESVPIGNISKIPDSTENLTCADRLFEMLRLRNPSRSLTRKRAYALIETYGESLVEHGMRILQKRARIQNPAGYLIAWLRRQKPDDRNDESRSAKEAEVHHERWVRALKQSPYASYFANADQLT